MAAAHWTFFAACGTVCGYGDVPCRRDARDFGYNVAAALDFYPIADFYAKTFDLVDVVQGGAADSGAADGNRPQGRRPGVSFPVRPT